MSGITLAVNLAISIAIILFLVLKFKINPVISMILASLYMGILQPGLHGHHYIN